MPVYDSKNSNRLDTSGCQHDIAGMKVVMSESDLAIVRKFTSHWVYVVLNIGMNLIDLSCQAVMELLDGFESVKTWYSFQQDIQ